MQAPLGTECDDTLWLCGSLPNHSLILAGASSIQLRPHCAAHISLLLLCLEARGQVDPSSGATQSTIQQASLCLVFWGLKTPRYDSEADRLLLTTHTRGKLASTHRFHCSLSKVPGWASLTGTIWVSGPRSSPLEGVGGSRLPLIRRVGRGHIPSIPTAPLFATYRLLHMPIFHGGTGRATRGCPTLFACLSSGGRKSPHTNCLFIYNVVHQTHPLLSAISNN